MIIMIMDIQLENSIWPQGSEKNKERMALYSDIVIKGEEWMRSGGFRKNLIEDYISKIETPHILAFNSWNIGTYFGEHKTIDYSIRHTNADFWKVFNFEFLEGRPYNNEEIKNGTKAIVISDRFAKFYFKGEDALNKTFEIEGEPYQIIGVVSYVSMLCENSSSDIWVPYTAQEPERASDDLAQTGRYSITMLLDDKNDMPKLKEEIAAIEEKYSNLLEDGKLNIRGPYSAMEDYFVSNSIRSEEISVKSELMNILLKWLLILIIPAINLVSINISRISERASEIGVRKAFGATKASIIKKSLMENTLLTLIGSFVGFGLAILATEIFKEKIFADLYSGDMHNVAYTVNFGTFAICIVATLIFSILSGVIPAFKTSKQQPATVLKGGAL